MRKIPVGLLVVVILVMVTLGFLPADSNPVTFLMVSDKWLHGIFFFLATFISFHVPDSLSNLRRIQILITWFLLSILSELVQSWLPIGRTWDQFDVLCNLVGVTFATLLSFVADISLDILKDGDRWWTASLFPSSQGYPGGSGGINGDDGGRDLELASPLLPSFSTSSQSQSQSQSEEIN